MLYKNITEVPSRFSEGGGIISFPDTTLVILCHLDWKKKITFFSTYILIF